MRCKPDHVACSAYLKHSGLIRLNILDHTIAREESQVNAISFDSVSLCNTAACTKVNQMRIYTTCGKNAYRLWPLMVLKT
jgi:hypothetical protein